MQNNNQEFVGGVTPLSVLLTLSPGSAAKIAGFVNAVRDHGHVVFVELRCPQGLLQVVCSPEFSEQVMQAAQELRPESSVGFEGVLRVRPDGTQNERHLLGSMELCARHIQIFNLADPLPFELENESQVQEQISLKYRYLQLRAPRLQDNIRTRHELLRYLREHFFRKEFIEIETPHLFRTSPEGAREFLIPSRLNPGRVYALPQSPQMLKQLLMMGGMGRYLQIARCYRDEDLRADRQPEFTQLDLEASFLSAAEFRALAENCFLGTLKALRELPWAARIDGGILDDLPASIPLLPYYEAMEHYGCDKPDLRFGLRIIDASAALQNTAFAIFARILSNKGKVRMLALPRHWATHSAVSRTFLDDLPTLAKRFGGQGLAWIRVLADGSWQGPAGKFFSADEKEALTALVLSQGNTEKQGGIDPDAWGEGSMLFFAASERFDVPLKVLGALRLRIAEMLAIPRKGAQFAWIVDWPLFESDGGKKVTAAHHPFTSPVPNQVGAFLQLTREELRKGNMSDWRADAFDLVLNGVEIGGGSARNYRPDVQHHFFKLLGLSDEDVQKEFGFFLQALRYGAPPHVGMALGIDRFCALILGEESIRDVIAFPKTGSGACLMSGAPSAHDWKTLPP